MNLTNDPQTNLKMIKQCSLEIYPNNVVLAQLTAAQAILESRLLSDPSELALKYNNLFGIKGLGTAKTPSVVLPTHEYNPRDGWEEVQERFASNLNLEDSLKQHKLLLELPRYKAVQQAKSFSEAAREVYIAGYATDYRYPSELIAIKLYHLQDMV